MVWEDEAETLMSTQDLKTQRASVKEVQALIDDMRPDRYLVRPLVVVVPQDNGKEA